MSQSQERNIPALPQYHAQFYLQGTHTGSDLVFSTGLTLSIFCRAFMFMVRHTSIFEALGALSISTLVAVWLYSCTFGFAEFRFPFWLSAFKNSVHSTDIHLLCSIALTSQCVLLLFDLL